MQSNFGQSNQTFWKKYYKERIIPVWISSWLQCFPSTDWPLFKIQLHIFWYSIINYKLFVELELSPKGKLKYSALSLYNAFSRSNHRRSLWNLWTTTFCLDSLRVLRCGLHSKWFIRKWFKKEPQACNFIKKEAMAQVFSCEFCEISKNTFSTEHLWTTPSFLDSSRVLRWGLHSKCFIRE